MKTKFVSRPEPRPVSSTRRVFILASIIVVWMTIITGRLIALQVFQHDWIRDRARTQQQDSIDTVPQRGVVYDRQGRELARSVDTETLYIEPPRIEDIHLTAATLAPLIGADSNQLETKLGTAKKEDKKSILLERKLSEDSAEHIRGAAIKGAYFVKEPKRYYPNGSLAAHILGYVGLDNDGQAGIEEKFDKRIKGEGGKLFLENDGARIPTAYASFETPSKPGDSVVLTIDQLIQYHAEKALQDEVEKTHAKSGSVVVLDPRTGEVLALANAPTFDPNNVRSATLDLRTNQALQNVYEPGSTFKVVAYSAAIEKKLVKPDDLIDCQMGAITVAGRLVHDHKKFGTLSIAQALAVSSNVAAIKLGIKVGDQAMSEYIERFGFGVRTGIELPGETPGLVRKLARWDPSSIGSIAMGQEVGVTPLQMAAAYATIANNGVRVAPHVVREIRAADGSVVSRTTPEQHRVVSEDTARQLRGMLEGVTLNGTAKRAQLEGYSAAGKTGTAQKIDRATRAYSKTKYIGSFVGFAPVENPSVVIIVVIDEPKGAIYGGDVAAPVFREIAEKILPEMDVAPDTELKSAPPGMLARGELNGEGAERIRESRELAAQIQRATLPESKTVSTSDGAGEVVFASATKNGFLMPNLNGVSVRDAMRVCAQLGLHLEARGDGRATRQDPSAGAEVVSGQTVRIDFGSTE